MNRPVRGLPLLAAALAAFLAAPAAAQSLPAAPVPVFTPPAVTPGPVAPPPITPPPMSPLPSSIDAPPMPPYHDPLPNHDALFDTPAAAPGLFGALEADIVKPHLSSHLSGPAFFGDGSFDTVQLPTARLDWTVAPRFELGYRMADGCGEFVISYRFLDAEGRADVPNFDPFADNADGLLKTRLSMNVFDFDYGTPEIPLGSNFDLKARVGVRLADVYFDSTGFGDVTWQRASNQFVGAGPHAALDGWYRFRQLGFGVFARVEGAVPVGEVHQRFEELFVFNDGSAFASFGSQRGTRWVPTINAQLGVGWAPPGTRLRFSAGYEYEQWWYVGHVGGSRAQLFDQGAFLRGEISF
jgi:Legionella pneumophila major outer membrane protein precursor